MISGDHGEAFGKRHKRNFTHKNYLYDENIRNFLLVTDFSQNIGSGLYSAKRGELADYLPTLLSLTGTGDSGLMGKSLFSDSPERLHYFHKNINPEQWGLRDGQFKFIAQKIGEQKPQLFDISKDPFEKNNIASKYPNRIEQYRKLVASWFIRMNQSFVENLEGFEYEDKKGMSVSDLNSFGPKRMAFGVRIVGQDFKVLQNINPKENMTVWTQGVSYPKNRTLIYQFISPNGKKNSFNFEYSSEWSTTYVFHGQNKPMTEGLWTVNIFDKKKKILSNNFNVSKSAQLYLNRFAIKEGPQHISFGSKKSGGEFRRLLKINPLEDMVVQILSIPYRKSTKLDFSWTSPSGSVRSFFFTVKKGWDKVWIDHSALGAMEEGEWKLLISKDKVNLISGSFQVSKAAPLFNKAD